MRPDRAGAPAANREEPFLRRHGRALFDGLEVRLAGSRLPARSALRLAGWVGAGRGLLSGRWPRADDVEALFATGPWASRRIALEIAAHEARDRLVLRRTAGRPLTDFAPLIRWGDPAAVATLTPPRILVTAHVGALHLMAAAMIALPASRTVLRWSPHHTPAAAERNANLAGGLQQRSQALLDAIAALRGGEFVTTTLDGGNGAAERVPLFGRPLDVGLGAFALARWTGVPIVPVAALWEAGGAVCTLGEPVVEPADTVRWLEALLRSSPAQISLGLLRRLLFGPPPEPAQ